MATNHYYFYCPHCEQLIKSTVHPVNYGTPVRQCPACGKSYIDPFCTEPALRKYTPLSTQHLLQDSFYGGIGAAVLITLAATFVVKDSTTRWIILGTAILLCIPLFFLWCLKTKKQSEEERLKRWRESDQRLRDPNYAATLQLFGYKVPAQYLPPEFWKKEELLSLPSAIVEPPGSFKKRNLKPHMPTGSDKY